MWNAFKTWNMRAVMAERECSDDAKKFQKAMDAEDDIAQIVATLGHQTDNIHLRKRVYVPSQDRCREIDVIAVCDALYVVEVKNWSGQVWMNDLKKWYQLPPVKGARAIEHHDLLEEINFKAAALVRFLSVNHRITLPQGSVRPIIVFSREGVKLDPKTVALHPQVFTMDAFKALVGPRHATWDFFTYYAPIIAGKAEITPDVRSKVSKALETLKTWDVVTLHDGTRVNGDIIRVVLPEVTEYVPAPGAVDSKRISFERGQIAAMVLVWSSNSWWGFAQSMIQGSAGDISITLTQGTVKPVTKADFADALAQHKSGGKYNHQKNAKEKRISRRVEKEGDFVLHATLTPSATKKNLKKEETNHIVVRPAGKGHVEVFPLALCASLQFNRR